MKNMKHKLIYEPVFRTETLFYACENSDSAMTHAKKKYNINIATDAFDGFSGTCLQLVCKATGCPAWLIWVASSNDWKIMVHETAHLVFRILDNRLVGYTGGNNETWCYLQEYFVSEFWHIMCKK